VRTNRHCCQVHRYLKLSLTSKMCKFVQIFLSKVPSNDNGNRAFGFKAMTNETLKVIK
jgi:hypothetical protein